MRKAIRSPYDHVGILLRDLRGNVYLVEATGKSGVTAVDMHHFLLNKWHDLYKKLVYRPLVFDKDDDFYRTFIRFANSVLGKKYSLTIKKLMRKKSLATEGEKGYFCSELVAAFFKATGLLPPHISAAKYWPGSFSQRSKLKLLKGQLGPEMVVDFNL
jgi:hypothetical protein